MRICDTAYARRTAYVTNSGGGGATFLALHLPPHLSHCNNLRLRLPCRCGCRSHLSGIHVHRSISRWTDPVEITATTATTPPPSTTTTRTIDATRRLKPLQANNRRRHHRQQRRRRSTQREDSKHFKRTNDDAERTVQIIPHRILTLQEGYAIRRRHCCDYQRAPVRRAQLCSCSEHGSIYCWTPLPSTAQLAQRARLTLLLDPPAEHSSARAASTAHWTQPPRTVRYEQT